MTESSSLVFKNISLEIVVLPSIAQWGKTLNVFLRNFNEKIYFFLLMLFVGNRKFFFLALNEYLIDCDNKVLHKQMRFGAIKLSLSIFLYIYCLRLGFEWTWRRSIPRIGKILHFLFLTEFTHLSSLKHFHSFINASADDDYSPICLFDYEFTTLLSVICKKFSFSGAPHFLLFSNLIWSFFKTHSALPYRNDTNG